MSWLLCSCGNHIKDMSLPQEGKAHIVTDDDLDGNTNYVYNTDLDGNTNYVYNTVDINVPRRRMYVCRECGRLLVETAPGSQMYIYFVPETDRLEI